MEPLFEYPPVYSSKSGVSFVRPIDILRSAAGQREIRKTMNAAIYTGPDGRMRRPTPLR